jgi:hypothetical protein
MGRCRGHLLGETLVNVSLVLQVGILVLLFVAAEFAYRRDFTKHGWTTTIAVALHSATILIVMIPSLLEEVSLLTELSTAGLVTQVHVILGTTAWILGLASISWWGIRKKTHSSLPSRFKRKWVMRIMLLVWIAALVIGIILHLFYI